MEDDRAARALLDLRDVAAVLGVSTSELRALARRGAFAPVLSLSRERARVAVADLDSWERRQTIGAAPGALRLTAAARALERARLSSLQGPERGEGEDASRDCASLP